MIPIDGRIKYCLDMLPLNDRQADGQTDRRSNRQTDSDIYIPENTTTISSPRSFQCLFVSGVCPCFSRPFAHACTWDWRRSGLVMQLRSFLYSDVVCTETVFKILNGYENIY